MVTAPSPFIAALAAAALTSAAAAQPHCQPYWRFAHDEPRRTGFPTVTFDDGSGPALYLKTGGTTISGEILRLRQNGKWQLIEDGIPPQSSYYPPVLLDDGSGPALYLIGANLPHPAQFWVARWDGRQWHPVYPGMHACWSNGSTRCRVPVTSALDHNNRMSIYGLQEDGFDLYSIHRWDETEWTEIGTTDRAPLLRGFDLGDGPRLYAMGNFNTIGGIPSRGFARWDGQQWIDLSHPDYKVISAGRPTVVYDDGAGPTIYTANNVLHHNERMPGILRWRSGIWESIGAPIPTTFTSIHDMLVFDDGAGPGLYISGGFSNINGIPARGVARYDSSGWSGLGPGYVGAYRLGALEMDVGPSLIVSQNRVPTHLGQYVGCPNCYPNCTGNTTEPLLTVDDFTCFIDHFAHGLTMADWHQVNHYANCTGSTSEPILSIDDFACFINKFAQGCD